MKQTSPNERLMRILQASPEQLTAIDRVLDGTTEPVRPERKGPFLMKMGDAAELLGVIAKPGLTESPALERNGMTASSMVSWGNLRRQAV